MAAVLLLNMGVSSVFAEDIITDPHEHNEACGYTDGENCNFMTVIGEEDSEKDGQVSESKPADDEQQNPGSSEEASSSSASESAKVSDPAAEKKAEQSYSNKSTPSVKEPLTITAPDLPDRKLMDPVPEITFDDLIFEGLKDGDDGPDLLRKANASIFGLPTDSYRVMVGSYGISPDAYNIPGYDVTLVQGHYYVGDKTFDNHPFSVSPEAPYTDKNGALWFNGPNYAGCN